MAHYDLIIAAIAALSLILLIMMFITRSLVAALVIVGTVALSLGASFGLSVLVWQHIMGVDLYWVILPLAVILLLAVGSDYNLLLVSRFKEEIHAGINTGIIRSMAGSGSVVTAAGLVFAFTMASFIFSDLRVLGQIGTTIALGLLFDTLIVRSFMTPSIAALLGRWFWWPVRVRQRPVPQKFGDERHAPAFAVLGGRAGRWHRQHRALRRTTCRSGGAGNIVERATAHGPRSNQRRVRASRTRGEHAPTA